MKYVLLLAVVIALTSDAGTGFTGARGARWGQITGTLSNQTDLQSALNTAAGTAAWGGITGASAQAAPSGGFTGTLKTTGLIQGGTAVTDPGSAVATFSKASASSEGIRFVLYNEQSTKMWSFLVGGGGWNKNFGIIDESLGFPRFKIDGDSGATGGNVEFNKNTSISSTVPFLLTLGGTGETFGPRTDLGFQIGDSTHNIAAVYTPSITYSTGVAIQGSDGTASAAAGKVGERIACTQTTATNFPTTTQWGDMCSVSLTAGDWDCTSLVDASSNTSTTTNITSGISVTTGNSNTGLVLGDTQVQSAAIPTAAADTTMTTTDVQELITATTTVYAKVKATYSVGNPQYTGRMSCRRKR